MQVFITGGTGLIGRALIRELQHAGHEVTAVARSDHAAQTLRDEGAHPVRGTLADVQVLAEAAGQADGVVHLAAPDELTDHAVAEETRALETIAGSLGSNGRPLVLASGTPWIPDRAALESDPLPTEGPFAARQRTVSHTLAFAEQGVRTTAVRIPRTAHLGARGGFAGVVVDIARRSGTAGWVGDGWQRWPAVHVLDAAAVFRLALERAEPGTSWHAVQEEGVPMRDIAETVGRRLGIPAGPVPAGTYGPLGAICALDQPASSAHTRRLLNWEPSQPTLLDDLETLRP